MRGEITPLARRDLLEIGDYIARDNPRRALSFVEELTRHCLALAAHPGLGTARCRLG